MSYPSFVKYDLLHLWMGQVNIVHLLLKQFLRPLNIW